MRKKKIDKKVAPKPIIIEFKYLLKNFDGPVITISLLLTNSSYQVSGGGSSARYSSDCLVLEVKRLTYPSREGSKITSGGYETALSTLLNPVNTIHVIGINVTTV